MLEHDLEQQINRTESDEIPKYIIEAMFGKLRKAKAVYYENEKGEIIHITGAVKGNKVQAYRNELRLNEIFEAEPWNYEKTLFLTLTTDYFKKEKGRTQSWEFVRDELPKFLRKLKEKGGVKKYFAVLEAYENGGCHVHVIAEFKRKFYTFRYKGEERITSKQTRDLINANWKYYVDIRRAKDKEAEKYLRKYLGKFSHIEDSVERARRNWSKKGDMRHKATDKKKLYSYYYTDKLKMRLYRCTKNLRKNSEEKQQAEPADLIYNMNKLTENETKKEIIYYIVPKYIKNADYYEPYNRKVKEGTKFCNELRKNMQKYKQH